MGGASWSSWGGVRQTDISSNSLCYKGRLSFTWLKGERALDQIYETYDFDGRIWDERHGGPGDERPLLTLMGYGGDYSDLEGNILALSTGQVVDQNTGNMAVLVNRFNALYGTNLTLDKPHTEVNGLSGLSAVRVNLPSVSLPEANPETYSSALALNSKEDSWFGGRLIFHYGKKRKVPDSGVGPEVLTGTTAAGYFGLIEPGEFHDAESLSEALNFHVGNIYTSDPGWFKFMYQGKILLICKGHLRSHINWTHLYQAGLVYGGPGYGTYPEGGNIEQGKSIIYGGRSYKVRLIRGSDGDPYNGRGGEWNALLNSMMNGVWGNFSHQDLNVQGGTGGASWCMESGSNTGEALVRDGTYDAYLRDKNEGSYSQYRGWRPVLELMSE